MNERRLHYAIYNSEENSLIGIHQSGFYSCINCLRISLYKLISEGILPKKISLENTLDWYKDHLNQDLYPILYKTDFSKIDKINKNFQYEMFCATAVRHLDLDLKNFIPIEEVYFLPSDIIVQNISTLEKKYNIDYTKTLAVLHRGTDKHKETKLSPVNDWIETIEKYYEEGHKILIQTDDENAKKQFIEHFKDRCFTLEEMIYGSDQNSNVKPHFNKTQWSINFESVMHIISKCNRMINHAGNVAMIPILYRKSLVKTIQFYNGEIIDHDKL